MSPSTLRFDQAGLFQPLHALDDGALDLLLFGTIGFDGAGVIRRYNAHESQATGLHPDRVIGRPLFTDVAQCMNNYLVARRFDDAAAAGQALDETIDFVLTWRMRPTPVQLRMLARPGDALRYVLLQRQTP